MPIVPVPPQPGRMGAPIYYFSYDGRMMRILNCDDIGKQPWRMTVPLLTRDNSRPNQIETLLTAIRENAVADAETNLYGKDKKLHDMRIERLVVNIHAGDRVEADVYWSYDRISEMPSRTVTDLRAARVLTWDDVYVEFADPEDSWLKAGYLRSMTIDTDLPVAEGEQVILPDPDPDPNSCSGMDMGSQMFVVNVRIGEFDFPRPIRLNLQRVFA